MDKKIMKITLAAFMFIVFALPYAYAAEVKIGYVDGIRLFDSYNKTKEQDKIFEGETNKKKEERDKLVNEIRKMKEEIDILSQEAKEKKQAQIDEKMRQLQEYDQETKMSLTQQRDKIMREILKEIDEAVAKYAEDNGYTFVLTDRALIYKPKQNDLTDKIINILNSKYPGAKAKK